MEAQAVGVARWIIEVSPTFYVEASRFAPVFRGFYEQQQEQMLNQSLRRRFASADNMENYFTRQYQEQARRRNPM